MATLKTNKPETHKKAPKGKTWIRKAAGGEIHTQIQEFNHRYRS